MSSSGRFAREVAIQQALRSKRQSIRVLAPRPYSDLVSGGWTLSRFSSLPSSLPFCVLTFVFWVSLEFSIWSFGFVWSLCRSLTSAASRMKRSESGYLGHWNLPGVWSSGPGHDTAYESHSKNILLASICLPDFLFSALEERVPEQVNTTATPGPNPVVPRPSCPSWSWGRQAAVPTPADA